MKVRASMLVLLMTACGPPSETNAIALGGTLIEPLRSFSAMPQVTDEAACIEELFVVVTDQTLECDAYATQTQGAFLLEGENRFSLRLNRGDEEERSGRYEVRTSPEGAARQAFVSADTANVNWRAVSGSAEVFTFDEEGASVSYSLELEQNVPDGARTSVSGGIVSEHCPALQEQLNRC